VLVGSVDIPGANYSTPPINLSAPRASSGFTDFSKTGLEFSGFE